MRVGCLYGKCWSLLLTSCNLLWFSFTIAIDQLFSLQNILSKLAYVFIMYKSILGYNVMNGMFVYLKYMTDINLIRFSIVLYAIKTKSIKLSRVVCQVDEWLAQLL